MLVDRSIILFILYIWYCRCVSECIDITRQRMHRIQITAIPITMLFILLEYR